MTVGNSIIYTPTTSPSNNIDFSLLFSHQPLNLNVDPIRIVPSDVNDTQSDYTTLFLSTNNYSPTISLNNGSISLEMLDMALKTENNLNFKAYKHSEFGEKFVTGPYGMTLKHIDLNGNLLKTPIKWTNGEKVSPQYALLNAKAYYDKRAKEELDLFAKHGITDISQDLLDVLVAATGGTTKSKNIFNKFVIDNWGNNKKISDFIKRFAITASGNGKVQPGLVKVRNFLSKWWNGIHDNKM